MSPLTADQERRRRRVEALIRLMAPALDLVLAAGDRVSRVTGGPHHPEPLATHPPDFPEPSGPAARPSPRAS